MHYYPSRYRLRRSVVFKAGGALACGPNVRRRLRFDYYLPYEIYECLIENQVGPGTDWLDVGGGKSVFPNNEHLANSLSRRCNSLIAVDPSENISKNPYADETHQLLLEEYETDRKFDLITARMVLEHVEQPVRFMQKAASLLKPEGVMLTLTVWKYAPISILAELIPFHLHHKLKARVWNTLEEDTFPTKYLLNTYAQQASFAKQAGLELASFLRVNDCSGTGQLGALSVIELAVERGFRKLRIPYPEHCLISAFSKAKTARLRDGYVQKC